jgi:hypothetical protein
MVSDLDFALSMGALLFFLWGFGMIAKQGHKTVTHWGQGDQPVAPPDTEYQTVEQPQKWTTEEEQGRQRETFSIWKTRDTNIQIGKTERRNPYSGEWEVVDGTD